MKRAVVALVAGTLFGIGLAISGMADPARVQGFLDITGRWDPTLVFVMGGAIIPMAAAWLIKQRMHKPMADNVFSVPAIGAIDRKLAVGAVLFGAGWGISGLCPGPGVANLALNPLPALIFVAAMLAGMFVQRVLP